VPCLVCPGARIEGRSEIKNAQIILLSIFAACFYGVAHDQITVRLCLEYFTIAHPPLFHTSSPTLLALCWGVSATAGIGAILGMVLALVSQSPGKIPSPVADLARRIFLLLIIMAVSAFAAGLAGYQLSHRGFISIPPSLAIVIPPHQHDRFMAVWFAHGASYLIGLSGGALLCFRIWQIRGRPSVITLLPRSRAAVIRAACIAALALFVIWSRFHAS
jgi:hypothetical protein